MRPFRWRFGKIRSIHSILAAVIIISRGKIIAGCPGPFLWSTVYSSWDQKLGQAEHMQDRFTQHKLGNNSKSQENPLSMSSTVNTCQQHHSGTLLHIQSQEYVWSASPGLSLWVDRGSLSLIFMSRSTGSQCGLLGKDIYTCFQDWLLYDIG